jgi:hypothetical protein
MVPAQQCGIRDPALAKDTRFDQIPEATRDRDVVPIPTRDYGIAASYRPLLSGLWFVRLVGHF